MDTQQKMSSGLSFQYLKNDLPAGLVVFLVALPLCLGIALASGAPLFAGIIAGVIGGTVVAFASGSSLSVSGPAAGLTVIVLNAITTLGSYEIFLLAVVIAGLLQIVLGFLKAGLIAHYFPSSVIKGMLAAIGIILIRKQIGSALGLESITENTLTNEATGISATFSQLFEWIEFVHPGAVIIAVLSLFVLIIWERPFLKKYTFFKFVPSALVVVILGVIMNELFKNFNPGFVLETNKLVQLPIATSTAGFFQLFTLPDFSAIVNYQVYVVAVTIAIIASLETLLSIEAADKLDPYKRNTPTNRELKAQGIGNLVSGMIGGLPLTAVIVRSSANINSGGRTKLSAIVHGVLLFVSVVSIASLLNLIPLACLAAVLLVIGYKLAKVSLFKSMYKLGWEQFLPFIITIVAIQFSDLLKGIAVGMVVAIFFILRNNYKLSHHYKKETNDEGEKITITLAEDVSFLNKGGIALTLRELPDNSTVIIDGRNAENIDMDVLEIIHDFKETASLKNIKLELIEIPAFIGTAGH